MILSINGRLVGYRAAVRRFMASPESLLVLCEVVLGRAAGLGRLGFSGHGVVKRYSGPVVYGAGRRERRKLRSIRRRVQLMRELYRARSAALRASAHGVLSDRLRAELLFRGGPWCWCGDRAVRAGFCRVHGFQGADV